MSVPGCQQLPGPSVQQITDSQAGDAPPKTAGKGAGALTELLLSARGKMLATSLWRQLVM